MKGGSMKRLIVVVATLVAAALGAGFFDDCWRYF